VPYIPIDHTGARHGRRPGVTTQIGGERFTVFRTSRSKSRLNFLSLLRAGCKDYVVNEAALDYLRRQPVGGSARTVPDYTPVLSTKDSFSFSAKLLRVTLISRSMISSGGQHGVVCPRGAVGRHDGAGHGQSLPGRGSLPSMRTSRVCAWKMRISPRAWRSS
jgi:hypothetical protein